MKVVIIGGGEVGFHVAKALSEEDYDITVIDTPGLLNPGQLTSKLTTEELRQVVPSRQINTITLRCTEGKTILIGAIARIELVEGPPFFLSFFLVLFIPPACMKATSGTASETRWTTICSRI